MARVARILSLIFSAILIRPHHHTCSLPLPTGRALPWPPVGWGLARPVMALRTPQRKAWELALVAILVLFSWHGALAVSSPPDLADTVVGAATHPSLALGSGPSPVLTHLEKGPPAALAELVPPTRDHMALEADDLDDETYHTSLAVLTNEALLFPLASAGKGTTGATPPFFWPSRYLTRPQLLKRF